MKAKLKEQDIEVQTVQEVAPIEVQPARVLSHLYTYLGRNEKLKLSGRFSRDVGILSTSKLYSLHDRIFAFTPQLTDQTRYYIASDKDLMIDIFKSEINFLKSSWKNILGRPILILTVKTLYLDQGKLPLPMITTMKKLRSGYINGTRVTLGNLNDFLSTSCITNLSFLGCQEIGLPERLNPEVQKYLESQLDKSLNLKIELLPTRAPTRHRPSLRRRMSVKGAIKKTRAIIGPESDGSQASDERRSSASGLSSGEGFPRSPSPEEKTVWKQTPSRHRLVSEAQYADTEVEELLTMLRESDQLEEQGDILQYLIDTQGMEFQTGASEDGSPITLKDLLKILYGKACQQKLWGLVRHTGGILGKRVEDLAKAVTDLLVRQKQVTVGMPPLNEHTITAPLPENELRQLIHLAYGDDESTAMLSQELLVYLAMFIRTEPQLFKEMLRLRIGLIIQVMATELSRNLNCSGEEASEHLLNLSPFEMKNLLHHIMSGKEFAISSASAAGHGNFSIISSKSRVSKKSQIGSILAAPDMDKSITEGDRQGQWLRRRRLDGALNRVPRDLYPRVWAVLERCEGIAIEGRVLHSNLTREMTSGELKFALEVESVLNTIPQPEYRQLVVEALMVLTLITEHNVVSNLGGIIPVENLVHKANQIFLDEQMKVDGDATLCCAKGGELPSGGLVCGGAGFICQHFYDSAPSGSFGTMTYIMKAVLVLLDCIPNHGSIECNLS
uniref:Phosphorylase b kinase regulatory subunit n=1 Tax=Lygus hesperus TaxID=30085 RepID=A0A0A9Y4T2_LYGHE